jgi:glycosyltransferase involved in cell wall biosynthesis
VNRANRTAERAVAPERMTVLAIYPWPEFWSMGEGQGAPSFFLSVTSFPKHGHEIHVLMPGGRGKPPSEDYHGVHLHRMRTAVDFMPDVGPSKVAQHIKILLAYCYWFVRAVPAGILLAARVRPDVVLGMGALGAPAAYLVARARGLPNVTRLFGVSLGEVAGSCLRTALRYPEINALRTPASCIILNNDGSAGDKIAARWGVPPARLLFWPNGVDKRAYTSDDDVRPLARSLGIPEGSRVVLAVSRLHPEKHVERLLAAAPRVLRERRDVVFLVVGEGSCRSELETLAAKLGIAGHVIFPGAFPQETMFKIYKLADVFVALSDRTNMGNPLNEAMMSGLPVIALDTGTTGDVIRDDETGILLDKEDLPRLGEITLGLLSDGDRAKRLGEAARRAADRRLPTIDERQAMEVDAVARTAREARGRQP